VLFALASWYGHFILSPDLAKLDTIPEPKKLAREEPAPTCGRL